MVLEDSGTAGSGNDDDDPVDVNSYLSVVKKLARLMRGLEEQDEFLSKDVSAPGTGKVYALCEMILEDLNNYCECMIPIGTTAPPLTTGSLSRGDTLTDDGHRFLHHPQHQTLAPHRHPSTTTTSPSQPSTCPPSPTPIGT